MMTHVVSLIDDCETAGDLCKSVNVPQAIRWMGQTWEAVEPSTIIKCFVNAGVLDKERNVVEAVEPPNDEDPFADLEDEVSQVEMLLNKSCGDTAVSAHEAIANKSLLPVCQELGENWEARFLSSLSSDSNGDNEGADSDDEEILELDDLQAPEPLKVKSYSEASSELNHVSDFFTAQGESNLADELCKIFSKAQSLYVKSRLANAVQKNITDFFNAK